MRLPFRGALAAEPGWQDGQLAEFAASVERALAPAPAAAEEARLTATRAAVLGAFAAATPVARPTPVPRRLARVALPLAVGLLAAGAVGAMASSAGQPFYGARIALEAVALPAAGEARERAQLDRLDARLREAAAAGAAADAPALRASLEAFAGIAIEAARQAAPDPGGASRVAAQLVRLEQLAGLDVSTEPARIRAMVAARGLLGVLGGGPGGMPGEAPPASGPGERPAGPEPSPSMTDPGRRSMQPGPASTQPGVGAPTGDGSGGGGDDGAAGGGGAGGGDDGAGGGGSGGGDGGAGPDGGQNDPGAGSGTGGSGGGAGPGNDGSGGGERSDG